MPRPSVLHSLDVSFDPTQIIIKQLVNALIEIHSRGVFHRDIKLENILIETDSEAPRIWVIDFGCATFLSDNKDTTVQGRFSFLRAFSLRQSSIFPVFNLHLCAFFLFLCGFASPRNLSVHLPGVVSKQVLPCRTHYSMADRSSNVQDPS